MAQVRTNEKEISIQDYFIILKGINKKGDEYKFIAINRNNIYLGKNGLIQLNQSNNPELIEEFLEAGVKLVDTTPKNDSERLAEQMPEKETKKK